MPGARCIPAAQTHNFMSVKPLPEPARSAMQEGAKKYTVCSQFPLSYRFLMVYNKSM